MEDLKARMKEAASGAWCQSLEHIPAAINEGIAAIDRITAERDGLRTQNETLAEIAKSRRDKCDALTAERDGLISENERLKAKLKELGHGER